MVESRRTADRRALKDGARRPDFFMVWIMVSGLWTAATILRIDRVWVPVFGWNGVLGNVYTWVSLLLPPWIFAVILLAVKRVESTGR